MSIEETLTEHQNKATEILDLVATMNLFASGAMEGVITAATCCNEVIRLTHEYLAGLTSSPEDDTMRELIDQDLINLERALDTFGILAAVFEKLIREEDVDFPERETAVRKFRN